MVTEVASGMVQGVEGEIVNVQADISDGLPIFYMIGYLSNEVREAKDRVRTALKNSGFLLPAKRISVNFAPADFRKNGTYFDLAVAVALLIAMGLVSKQEAEGVIFLGELSLDGKLSPVSGVLPIVSKGVKKGYDRCIVPKGNEKEAAFIEKMEVFSFSTLQEVFCYLIGESDVEPEKPPMIKEEGRQARQLDFSDVRGQNMAKRAIEIAAAGFHNLFLDGPPGVGKSMLAACMPGIMPDMTREEMIETTMIYSVKGLLREDFSLVQKRPFRAPSHAVTQAGMFGGGRNPKPGEASLAHHGILFLDELPEFSREMIEMFRIPMERHSINMIRNEKSLIFPADFLLVAAANPCPCGYYPDLEKCHCKSWQIDRYQSKISGPILDRLDLFVRCDEVSYDVLSKEKEKRHSEHIRKKIEEVWNLQKERFQKEKLLFNSRMEHKDLEKYCALDGDGNRLMKAAFQSFALTGRSYFKILKISRTIADLEGCMQIRPRHLEEALQFRNIRFKNG